MFIYVDDIIIYPKNLEDHLRLLKEVFLRLEKANYKIKISKCQFMKPSTEILGSNTNGYYIFPLKEKVDKISRISYPSSLVEL